MASGDKVENRARTRTWPLPWPGGARPAWGIPWPRSEFHVAAHLRKWAAEEVAAGRLLPWLAVAYGLGIVIYFTADSEPSWLAAVLLASAFAISAVLLRRHLVAFVVTLFLFAIAAGFAVATVRTALIDHTVLRFSGIMAQTPEIKGRYYI